MGSRSTWRRGGSFAETAERGRGRGQRGRGRVRMRMERLRQLKRKRERRRVMDVGSRGTQFRSSRGQIHHRGRAAATIYTDELQTPGERVFREALYTGRRRPRICAVHQRTEPRYTPLFQSVPRSAPLTLLCSELDTGRGCSHCRVGRGSGQKLNPRPRNLDFLHRVRSRRKCTKVSNLT